MKENVINLPQHRLTELAGEIHDILQQQESTWYGIGKRLSEARQLVQGDTEFGQWCTEQAFGVQRQTLFAYRQCYEFTARYHDSGRNFPTDWNVVYGISTMPEAKQAEILNRIKAGETFSRAKFKKEYPGKKKSPAPKTTQSDLNKKMRELEAQEKKKDKEIEKLATKMAMEAIEEKVAQLREKLDETSRERQLLDTKSRGIPAVMTKDDYKIVLGCLHPDRPNRSEEQLRKAFTIMKGLEPLLK